MNSPQPDMAERPLEATVRAPAVSIEEQIWVLQAQQGDEEAFARLVDLHDRKLMEQLLDQELPATSDQYLAYRRKISESLHKVQEERVMRIMTKAAWAVTGIVYLIGFIIDFNRDSFPEMVRLTLIPVTVVCLACAVAFLAFYLINYRPRLRNTQQEAVLLGLQRQMQELREQLRPTGNGPPSDRADHAPPAD